MRAPRTFEQAAVAGFAFFLQQRLLAAEPLQVEALLAETLQIVIEPSPGPRSCGVCARAAPAPAASGTAAGRSAEVPDRGVAA